MSEHDRSFWNFTALIVFLALLALCVHLIRHTGGLRMFWLLNWFDLIIISLATFRFAHLLTYDKIFGFVRHFFLEESREAREKPTRVASRVAYEMLECLWCTGIWSALIVFTIYLLGIWGQFIVIVFAVAGAAAILQVLTKALMHERI
jgi:hypothetical protein